MRANNNQISLLAVGFGDDFRGGLAAHHAGVHECHAGSFGRVAQLLHSAFTGRKYGGIGLGLSITKVLAQQMGGDVGVNSVRGKGATFWFTVDSELGSPNTRRIKLQSDMRGRPVLVVDDVDNTRQVPSEMLGRMSFVAGTASTGEAALQELLRADAAGQAYDVVLLD